MNLGIYLRISSDPDNTQQATRRQEEDCREFAQRLGLTIVEAYEDVDISGFKRVERPSFDRLLADLKSGRLDGFIAYRVERVLRNWRDWVRLEEIREKNGAFILTVDGNDTRTSTGRSQFELFVYMAKLESEKISERTKRKHDDSARKGLSHAGGRRAYGYDANHAAIREDEAVHIRDAARRFIEGETLSSICRGFREQGILTPTGGLWSVSQLRQMLERPHLAGVRVHHGVQTPGAWPAILAVSEHERIGHILKARTRITSGPWVKYLLSRLAVCGACGSTVVGRRMSTGKASYVCQKQANTNNCGRLGRLVEPTDATVAEKFLAELTAPHRKGFAFGVEAVDVGPIEEAVRVDEALLFNLGDMLVEGAIGREEYARLSHVVSTRLRGAREALAAAFNGRAFKGATPEALRDSWFSEGIEWRRAALRLCCERITIHPAGRGRRVYNPDLITLEWRGLGE